MAFGAVDAWTTAKRPVNYYQGEFGPAVLFACGHGLQNPQGRSAPEFEALDAFLLQQRPSLDCAQLPADFAVAPLQSFSSDHRYLLLLAGVIWKVSGISWASLKVISMAFAGLTTGAGYLFLRAGMGPFLAIVLSVIGLLSPLQLGQMAQLRDYSKAPFLALMLCAVAWLALVKASRRATILGLFVIGGVLGVGFGMRADVVSYLPMVLVVLACFRPGLDRADAITRSLAAVAAIAAFLAAAGPILSNYQRGNNFTHVAMLGLTDASREALALRGSMYSFAYWYDDTYQNTITQAYADRATSLTEPVRGASREYAFWGDDYYRRLLETFPADMLLRAWAAVIRVFALPFESDDIRSYPWIDPGLSVIFDARRYLLSWLGSVPTLAAAALGVCVVSVYSVRLAILLGLGLTVLPGIGAIQFQGRHVFHLELLPLFTCGATLSGIWRIFRRRVPRVGLQTAMARVVATAVAIAAGVVVPLSAARRYQAQSAGGLLSAYEAAETRPLDARPSLGAGVTIIPIDFGDLDRPHFIDTNVLSIDVGTQQCDTDQVSLTFRYRANVAGRDLSRRIRVEVPAAPATTRVIFPVYTDGQRSFSRDPAVFVGIETPIGQEACLAAINAFAHPEQFSLLLESTLIPDWRNRSLHETLSAFELPPRDLPFDYYSIPEGLEDARISRRWLSRIQPVTAAPFFRSKQVTRVDADGIEQSGRSERSGTYLVAWPTEPHLPGSAFFVEGEVFEGGLTIGVQQDEQWVHQLNVDRPSRFRAVIVVENGGAYGPVLANHQLKGGHRSTITRYGWLPPAQP